MTDAHLPWFPRGGGGIASANLPPPDIGPKEFVSVAVEFSTLRKWEALYALKKWSNYLAGSGPFNTRLHKAVAATVTAFIAHILLD